MSELTLKRLLKAVAQDANDEAARLGRGWCLNRYLTANPRRHGDRAGVLYVLTLLGLMTLKNRQRVKLWLYDHLPACTHRGEDGQPSCCITEYHAHRRETEMKGAKMLDSDEGGFRSLLDELRSSKGINCDAKKAND